MFPVQGTATANLSPAAERLLGGSRGEHGSCIPPCIWLNMKRVLISCLLVLRGGDVAKLKSIDHKVNQGLQ